MRAHDIMSTPPVTVSSLTAVSRATKLFTHYRFSAMPVIDHAGDLIGVVSEADLIRNEFAAPQSPLGGGAGAASDRPAHTVGEVMTSPPEVVDKDAGLDAIIDILLPGRRRSIPVVDGRRVVGVITRHDILPFVTHSNQHGTVDKPLPHAEPPVDRSPAEPRPAGHRPTTET